MQLTGMPPFHRMQKMQTYKETEMKILRFYPNTWSVRADANKVEGHQGRIIVRHLCFQLAFMPISNKLNECSKAENVKRFRVN